MTAIVSYSPDVKQTVIKMYIEITPKIVLIKLLVEICFLIC